MTDRALAARLEELTTLQQIDRELNASLDVERVLDLTLSWAVRAIEAGRGTMNIVDEDGACHTVSCAGDEGAPGPEVDVVQMAVASQEPVVVGDTRMLIPVRYEDRTIGLLDLWSEEGVPFRPDQVEFAGRLADHAAGAIENARLYEQVQQADRAKSEFVSFVAHELRTPMTSIRGYADMLKKGMMGPLASDQEEFIDTISRNAERMQVLVSDLQDISRIETRQLRLEMKPTDLTEALKSALQSIQAQIEARSQRLSLDVPEYLPPVYADPARLAQILINLLSNANKYTPKGGRIGVRAWLQEGQVHCAVSDTGVGISPEDQAQLFTKFFRSEDPAVREMNGTGLGLCIVKSLVELQGGEIEFESRRGEGTTFLFTLPISVEE
jgi:signal transduction histidine kinase